MERIDEDQSVSPIKSTANHLFVCTEGRGNTRVEENIFNWQRGDVVAVPSWQTYEHRATSKATLLEITDQPVIQALGWYREA